MKTLRVHWGTGAAACLVVYTLCSGLSAQQPAAGQPAPAQPGAQPAPAQPGAQPAPAQPGAQPAPAQPGAQPAAAQPGAVQPEAAQPAPSPAAVGQSAAAEPAPSGPVKQASRQSAEPVPPRTSRTVTVAPMIGFLLAGSGTWEQEVHCNSEAKANRWDCSSRDEVDFDQSYFTGVGANLFFNVADTFRLGPALFVAPGTKVELDSSGDEYKLGTELDGLLALEFALPTSSLVDVLLQGQVGPTLLFAGKDLQRETDQTEDWCREREADLGVECDVSASPYWGLKLGVGAGLGFNVRRVSLRALVLYQHAWQRVQTLNEAHEGVKRDTQELAESNRFLTTFGVEL